jgi:NMD protein affecting ribosome stability and mRNA decay
MPRTQTRALRAAGTGASTVRGSRSGKFVPAAKGGHAFADPTACERCGAVYTRKTWRRRDMDPELLGRASWDVCPACRQEAGGEFFGLVEVRGALEPGKREEVERRIRSVAARAEFTQPQRRVIDVRSTDGGLEVLTTSQKLAHRLAHELQKAFGGRTGYSWSDRDGRLVATWEA